MVLNHFCKVIIVIVVEEEQKYEEMSKWNKVSANAKVFEKWITGQTYIPSVHKD